MFQGRGEFLLSDIIVVDYLEQISVMTHNNQIRKILIEALASEN